MNLRHKGIKDIFTKFGNESFKIWFSGIEDEGEYKLWYDNGQLGEHGFYKNGRREGKFKLWDYSGWLSRHSIYKDGKKIKDLK